VNIYENMLFTVRTFFLYFL